MRPKHPVRALLRQILLPGAVALLCVLALVGASVWFSDPTVSEQARGIERRRRNDPIEAVQAMANAAEATPAQKIAAARILRRQARRTDPDPREAIVETLVELARATDDENLRADVFRQLDEVVHPTLRDALVEALENDPSNNVRSEAAESLGPFPLDDEIEELLSRIAESDPNSMVRHEAKSSLEEVRARGRIEVGQGAQPTTHEHLGQ